MNQTSLSITVFFEDPFWIALFEYREDPFSYLKRVVFGSEPSEQLVYDWIIQNWYKPVSYTHLDVYKRQI